MLRIMHALLWEVKEDMALFWLCPTIAPPGGQNNLPDRRALLRFPTCLLFIALQSTSVKHMDMAFWASWLFIQLIYCVDCVNCVFNTMCWLFIYFWQPHKHRNCVTNTIYPLLYRNQLKMLIYIQNEKNKYINKYNKYIFIRYTWKVCCNLFMNKTCLICLKTVL